MSWFERLFGVPERGAEAIREALAYDGETLRVRASGRTFRAGRLETPSLGELRRMVGKPHVGRTTLREWVGDAHRVHADARHAGATIQAASQANLLEMPSPTVTPDAGIGGYESDRTQGPACAIAAGAGTVVRAYFVPCRGGLGQTSSRQLDMLEDFGAALDPDGRPPWTMQNGYPLLDPTRAPAVEARLCVADDAELDALRARVRVGIMVDTEVTLPGCHHTVTQVYTSGLPIAYGAVPYARVPRLAGLVLEAAYEATLLAAARTAAAGGSRTVFLTFVGAGVFGNPRSAVLDALARALTARADDGLDVVMVSFGAPAPDLIPLLARFGMPG